MSGPALRWIAAAGALVMACLLLWLPYSLLSSQAAERERVEQQVSALEQRISTREQLLAEARLLERTSPLASLLLAGQSTALAGANLQGTLTRMVEDAGGLVRQAQVLDGKTAEPFVQVGVRIDFTTSMTGLRDILHEIETSKPLLIVERLTLAAERRRGAEIGEQVEVSVEIAAFSRQLVQ